MQSDRRGSYRPQPKGTVPYEVQPSDTLEGIAARYNITPSELTKLNKLISRTVFSGQIIYIPESNSLEALEQILKESAANILNEQGSPKPGHVERVSGAIVDNVGVLEKETADISAVIKGNIEDSGKESLRINSKYVTDGEGVVSGVLIVTTNHIIFDPNVSDPLVIEYGMDKYGVEAPMGCIVKAALYSDIFRIKKDPVISGNKTVDVYHSVPKGVKKSKSDYESLNKGNRRYSAVETGSRRHEYVISGSSSFQENLSKICENADDAEKESEADLPQNFETSDNTTDEDKNKRVKGILITSSSVESDEGSASRKGSTSDDEPTVSFEPISPKKKSNFEKTKSKIHKGFKRLSISDNLFSNAHSGRRMSLPVFGSLPDFKHKSSGTKSSPADKPDKSSEEEKSGPSYVNMVEEKPELFAPLDRDIELIPRPAKSFCDTPLYLCLRMGLPIAKSLPRSNPVIHFGQKMKPEYWFSIPKDNVDSLYHFFLRWCPEKYGEIDNINYEELGYTCIESEEQDTHETKSCNDHRRASWAFPWRRKSKDATEATSVTSSSPEDWEFLDCVWSKVNSVLAPELLTPSTILNEEQIMKIAEHLPARAMNSWTLIYGTTAHGFSLKTMYRKMSQIDSPVLIVIANRNNDIFGALLSSPLKISDHFYGTGESFLFSFSPEFKVFRWSGENNYFIKGNTDSFMVGSSEGHFGLWLDDDLFRGRTNSCQTFANDPLCAEQDFEVKSLEAWGFV